MRRADLVRAVGGLGAIASIAIAPACLKRDVSPEQPTTKISFTNEVPQPAIDKVDVLLMIDNSSSMADKQKILADAVPDLVRGLVQPKCVDRKTRADTGVRADPLAPDGAQCPAGAEPAFPPISDMHIGIVDSSMGTFGGDVCLPNAKDRDNDDHGRLVARGVPEAGDLRFLAWYPDVAANADKARHPEPPVPKIGTLDAFGDAFRRLVVGVGQNGCGLEAQLESWYHFLVQPDPWTAVDVDAAGRASYGPRDRVDVDLLRQRAAFLRPDSLVAVIVLTDEDDSSVDPLAFSGTAWTFESRAPRARSTAACDRDPTSAACTSCELAPPGDPACARNAGFYTSAEDDANARFVRMKRRFGVDPQFSIARYIDALTNPHVPPRDGRAPACTNPLFAARLPLPGDELCTLPRGPRTKDLVYFAVIGGVPNELLPAPGASADAIDWTPIVGRDPSSLDDEGLDVHMLQSIGTRHGLPSPDAPDDADPISGREWDTSGRDLQYACTFALPEARPPCLPDPSGVLPTCDCDGKQDPPLCTPRGGTTQSRGKAYPTRRELLVAKGLGDHAIVSSLCAKQLVDRRADDYGYRPAIRALGDRLASQLLGTCLPRALPRDAAGEVSCSVLAVLPDAGPDSDCQTRYGLANPSAEVLAGFRDQLAASDGDGARRLPVCEIPQLVAPDADACRHDASQPAFCYAEHDPAARLCSQELVFTKPTARLAGARFSLQCITVSDGG